MKLKLTLIALIACTFSFAQSGWYDLGTYNNFPSTTESQFKIKQNGKPVFAYIDAGGDPQEVIVKEWKGTSWIGLPSLMASAPVYDLRLVINGNTLYLGVGDLGTSYTVYKLVSGSWEEVGGGPIPNTNEFDAGSVRLSCGQDEDDLSLSFGTSGGEFKMFRYDGGVWDQNFGNEINMTLSSMYFATHVDHVMFDNSERTFVLLKQNQLPNISLMTHYVNQSDGGVVSDSVRDGSDQGFLTLNPGIIRIAGDPTIPDGPIISYIGNDNEDFINVKKINSSDPNQYIDLPGFQEPGLTNISDFDLASDNSNQAYLAYVNVNGDNNAVFYDGVSWTNIGPQIHSPSTLTYVDMEIFQSSNKPYVMYESPSGSGVRVFNNPPQYNSNSAVSDLCETSSPSSVGIVSDIQFNDVDHDSLYVVSITSSDQGLILDANLSISRTSAYDPNSPANNFEISATPEADVNGLVTLTITVSDGLQTTSRNIAVTINSKPSVNAGSDQMICEGSSTTLTGSGTASSYAWDNSVTDGVSFTPSVGTVTYTVTGTDLNGCTNTASAVIAVTAAPTYTISTTTAATCFGLNDGEFTMTGLTPATNYTIDLGSGGSIYTSGTGGDITISGLSASTYTIDITDNSTSCSSTSGPDATITEPSQLAFISSFSPQTICEGTSITLDHGNNALGGTPTYSYVWDNGVTNAVAFTPPVGNNTYTLTITDANGCSILETADVDVNAAPPAFSAVGTNPTVCGGSDGSIDVTGLLPSTNYNLTYDNPSTVGPTIITTDASGNYTISGLSAGSYSNFIIENGNLCQTTLAGPVSLSDPSAPFVTAVTGQNVCAGSNFTAINFTGTGGATFNWTNDNTSIGLGASGTGDIASFTGVNTGSTAEIATITVTPTLGGCTGASESFTLTVNPIDDAGFTYSSTTFCEDETTGPTVNTNTGGGTFAYTVVTGGPTLMLNAGGGQIGISSSNVGVYDITYTTSGACPSSSTEQVSINALPTLTNTNPTAQYCSQQGEINLEGTMIPVGGIYDGNFINNNHFNSDIATIGTHSYSYTYTDANGCTNVEPLNNIEVLSLPSVLSATTTNTTCDQNDGSVTGVTISGGTAPYNVYWSNGAITNDISNLSAQTYYINLTDANNCYNMDVFTISSFAISLNGTVTDVTCIGENNGSIDLSVSGTTGPYTFYWSNGATTEDISDLSAGQYEVFVTDNNGCMSTKSFNVGVPNAIDISLTPTNPTACGVSDGSVTATVTGGTGVLSYNWTDEGGTSIGTTNTLNSIDVGTYTMEVSDENNCVETQNISISNNAGPSIELVEATNSSCNNDGVIDVNVSSINPITSTIWSNGETSEDISNLSPGLYSLVVTDNNNCKTAFETDINQIVPEMNEICIVTVDTNTNTNLIVWEKPVSSDIDFFVLYRETAVAGQYLIVDTIDYNEESQYTDLVAYPQYRSWRYKLASVNSCGVSSVLSPSHKTIHITYNENTPGTFDISWDDYEGFSYANFELYRYTIANGWELLQTLPNTTFSYSDTPADANGVDYIISITPPSTCTSTGKAQDHNASRSNKSSNITAPPGPGENEVDDSGVDELSQLGLSVYPNPSSDQFYVSVNTSSNKAISYNVSVYDLKGSLVYSTNAQSSTFVLDLQSVESGSYVLEIKSDTSLARQQIIKN